MLRGMLKRFLIGAVGVAAMLGAFAVPAHAAPGSWQVHGPPFNRTCSATKSYSAVAYQVCVEFSATRGSVQASVFVTPSATRYIQADVRLWFGAGGGSLSVSCPTYAMAAGQGRRCSTGWLYQRRPYVVADATVGIQGTWMPMERALDMSLVGRRQEHDDWCGPGAVQTALATMAQAVPSQATLAEQMGTGRFGTMPWAIRDGLNRYLSPTLRYRYEVLSYGASGLNLIYGMDMIRQSLSRGMPVIILVDPAQLRDPPDTTLVRHYLTIVGFGGSAQSSEEPVPWGIDSFKVWNPASGERAISDLDLIDAADHTLTPDDFYIITSIPR
jgi:hypothetical protein